MDITFEGTPKEIAGQVMKVALAEQTWIASGKNPAKFTRMMMDITKNGRSTNSGRGLIFKNSIMDDAHASVLSPAIDRAAALLGVSGNQTRLTGFLKELSSKGTMGDWKRNARAQNNEASWTSGTHYAVKNALATMGTY